MEPAVTTVELHAHLAAAEYLMRRAHATALVVITDDGTRRPFAVITDTDIARAVAAGRAVDETYIGELVRPQPVTVSPETSVGSAVAIMISAGIRHLPVVEHGHLLGIFAVTAADPAVPDAGASAQRRASAG
jgi:acetoin utilization protein AcuB